MGRSSMTRRDAGARPLGVKPASSGGRADGAGGDRIRQDALRGASFPKQRRSRASGTPMRVAAALVSDRVADLMPGEHELIATSTLRRRAEYSTGRSCARRALRLLGAPQVPIRTDRNGAPAWPDGYTGSISHCSDLAISLVAPLGSLDAVGVDVEKETCISQHLLDKIGSPSELDMLSLLRAQNDDIPWGLIWFSSKESVFKCLYQATHHRFSFRDILVRISVDGGLSVSMCAGIGDVNGRLRIWGSWVRSYEYVATAVHAQAPAAPELVSRVDFGRSLEAALVKALSASD